MSLYMIVAIEYDQTKGRYIRDFDQILLKIVDLHNELLISSFISQLRVDRYATFAGLIGAGASQLAKKGIASGLFIGITAGTISASIQNVKEAKE